MFSKSVSFALFFLLSVQNYLLAVETQFPSKTHYQFIENKGQIIDQNNEPNPACLFLYNGNGLKIQLRKNGFSYEITRPQPSPKEREYHHLNPYAEENDQDQSFENLNISHKNLLQGASSPSLGEGVGGCAIHRIDIFFENMNNNVLIEKENKSTDYINYYTTGTPEQGISHVYHYGIVRYKNVYPNIDFEFEITKEGKAEYYWIVKPQGNIEDIKLRYEGADETKLQDGEIVMKTSQGNLEERIPASYYLDNKNELVDVSFNQPSNSSIFNYVVSSYNRSRTLVIDPTPNLEWGTYFGGNDVDRGYRICSDSKDNLIITGYTWSPSNIASSLAYQTVFGGYYDAFIAKFDSAGSRLWATYYGGNKEDIGYNVCSDIHNNIIVSGTTYSVSSIATSSAYQTTIGGSADVFISKFDSTGLRLWASYFGGSGYEEGYGIFSDSQDHIIITGLTLSTSSIATLSAHQTTLGGDGDAFIAKFDSGGSRLWATYYGGSKYDLGYGICSDSHNNIMITGLTLSTSNIAGTSAYQTTLGGGNDAFIAKFDSSGLRLWATYYGGSGDDTGVGIDNDVHDNIIITGHTKSTSNIASSSAYQTSIGGLLGYYDDAFIAKFNKDGSRLWATYFGGESYDYGIDICIGSRDNIIINGHTGSKSNIATTSAYQTSLGGFLGLYDSFIANFDSAGSVLWATYYGGEGYDYGFGICSDSHDNIIVSGNTTSTSSIASSSAYQTVNGGMYDAFIAKFKDTTYIPPITAINLANSYSANSVFIYPNPAQTTFSINFNNNIYASLYLELFDVSGKILLSTKIEFPFSEIDISKIKSGIYALKITTSQNESFMNKFIIK